MPALSTILLDFDGTIVDSTKKHIDALARAFIDFIPQAVIDPDELQAYTGVGYDTCITQMLAQRGIDDESLVQEITQRAIQRYTTELNTITCVTGVEAFITSVHEQGLRLGVVSGSPHKEIDHILRTLGLADRIEHIVGREDVAAFKPHPDPYMRAMNHLGVTHEETIAFEDSPAGVESAWLASIPTIGILTSFEAEDLHKTVRTIRDYTTLTLNDLHAIHRNHR